MLTSLRTDALPYFGNKSSYQRNETKKKKRSGLVLHFNSTFWSKRCTCIIGKQRSRGIGDLRTISSAKVYSPMEQWWNRRWSTTCTLGAWAQCGKVVMRVRSRLALQRTAPIRSVADVTEVIVVVVVVAVVLVVVDDKSRWMLVSNLRERYTS